MATRTCFHCAKTISGRQQSLQCTTCDHWQHRTCGTTGVTQDAYREAARLGQRLDWSCAACGPVAVATLLGDLKLNNSKPKRVAKVQSLKTTHKTVRHTDKPLDKPAVSVTKTPTNELTEREGLKRVAKLPSRIVNIPPVAPTQTYDDLDDLDLPPVVIPDAMSEDDLPAPIPDQHDVTPDPDFQILDDTTQRGKPKLIDNLGYTYTLAREGKTVTAWRCAVRNSKTTCSATVQQRGEQFTRGPQPHNHSGQPGAAANARIQREIKAQATAEIFEPALNLVETVIRNETRLHGVRPGIPTLTNLTRMANYTRQQLRPEEPQDLEFAYDSNFIPDFLVGDIKINEKRHLLFASPQQLQLLSKAKTWYLDGTFKVVREPFTQLWSVHAFVASGQDTKQLPFLYVLMSSRRTVDYKAIFNHLITILPKAAQVKEMVLDFELSLWNAIKEIFPDVVCRGCAFHWTQCVWRRVQTVGLQCNYMQEVAVHRFCKQLLGLPFIPSQHIRPVFEKLQERATTEKLQELTDYIQVTCIESSI